MNNSVGVFWGTFDPPTLAHRDIILKMLELFQEVIIVVKKNAKKNYFVDVSHRIIMLKKMLASNNSNYKILVQENENENNYFDIHKNIKEKLFVVAGLDTLCSWLQEYGPEQLKKYDGVYVVPRNNECHIDFKKFDNVFELLLDNDHSNTSSTNIRTKLSSSKDDYCSLDIDSDILNYILENSLYNV